MAQWAKQWTYLSNFMGEGSKPEQLYIFCILYDIEKINNIILYICLTNLHCIFNITLSSRFFNMV